MFSYKQLNKPIKAAFQQIRLKRTKAGINPEVQRIITQLSVLSAGRKQPKLLKLCNEDYVKHQIVTKAWSQIRSEKKKADEAILSQQYQSMADASEELKQISPELYEMANVKEYGKRFPLEIRVPTEFPPRKIWYYDYVHTLGRADN